VHRDPHLAPAGEDVHGPVVVAPEIGPVGRGGLGELLHLLAQGGDVLPGLLEGEGELLVAGQGLGQLPLDLQQALLEVAHPPWGVLEPAAEAGHLILEETDLLLQLLHVGAPGGLVGPPGATPLLVETSRRDHLLRRGRYTAVPPASLILRHISLA
jgi:hypothetical protein